MFAVIRGAAEVDADCRELWELIHSDFHDLQATVVKSIHRSGALRPGLTAHPGADILWTLNHPAVVLVHGYGWTPREVAELTGIAPTSVQNHVERGLARLRAALEVRQDA
jgi:Sigma-70, region 4